MSSLDLRCLCSLTLSKINRHETYYLKAYLDIIEALRSLSTILKLRADLPACIVSHQQLRRMKRLSVFLTTIAAADLIYLNT